MRVRPGADLLFQRIARHGFIDRPATSASAAARLTCGLQAQDLQAARLSVRSRSESVTDADVIRAIDVDRSVVRTSLMRATIHLVDARDARWLMALIGPAIARKFQSRWRELGLSTDVLTAAVTALPEVLESGPRTRGEVVTALAARGLAMPSADPATSTHLLLHATTLDMVCRGPDRGREATFVLLEDWLPDAPAGPRGDDALAELARRYFHAFSPATAADFSAWSGLASGRAISLIREELTAVDVGGSRGYTLGEVAPLCGLRLLSAFDNYLVGYRARDLLIDAGDRPRVYLGGMIRPSVLLDGRVIGTWRLNRRADSAAVELTMFSDGTGKNVRAAVEAECEDIARFLGLPTALVFTAS